MVSLTTPVSLPASPPRLAYGQVGLSFGSCFSERIGSRLERGGLSLLVNPFGIQYNPLSIASGLRRLLQCRLFTTSELVEHGGLYHSFAHHGRFSQTDPAQMLEEINGGLQHAASLLPRTDYLLLTWGTAYVYRLADPRLGEVGEVVSNCHKFPEKSFARSRVSVDELLAVWCPLLEDLFARSPNLRVIQTVSPVRHLRDGAHGNAVSKSTLLLFAEALTEYYPDRVHYFPAYEIVLDELRDYRFYGDNLTHPSALAQQIIWERFLGWAVDPATQAGMKEVHALERELTHRPLHASGEAHLSRLARLRAKLQDLQARYPHAQLNHLDQWID